MRWVSMHPTSAAQGMEFRKQLCCMEQMPNIAEYGFLQPGGESIHWVWAVPTAPKPQRPFPNCERHLAFGSAVITGKGPFAKCPLQPTELPLQLPHPSWDHSNGLGWNCSGKMLQSASDSPLNKCSLLKTSFQSLAYLSPQIWTFLGFLKVSCAQGCPSLILQPLKWWFLPLSLGSEQSCPLQAPGGSRSPGTAIREGCDLDFSIFVWKSPSWCHFTPYKSLQYQAHKPKWL